jgi:hypothetical protein
MSFKDMIAAGGAVPYLFSQIGNRKKFQSKIGALEDENAELKKLQQQGAPAMKKGGKVKKHAKGGVTRGDGICKKGHTKGKYV